jgi:hypothetical protein
MPPLLPIDYPRDRFGSSASNVTPDFSGKVRDFVSQKLQDAGLYRGNAEKLGGFAGFAAGITPAAGAYDLGQAIYKGDPTGMALGGLEFAPLGILSKGLKGRSEELLKQLGKRADPNRATRPSDVPNIQPGPKNPNSPFYKPDDLKSRSKEELFRLAVQGKEQRIAKEANKRKTLESKHQLDIDEDAFRRDGIPDYGEGFDYDDYSAWPDDVAIERAEGTGDNLFSFVTEGVDPSGVPIPVTRYVRGRNEEEARRLAEDLNDGFVMNWERAVPTEALHKPGIRGRDSAISEDFI